MIADVVLLNSSPGRGAAELVPAPQKYVQQWHFGLFFRGVGLLFNILLGFR